MWVIQIAIRDELTDEWDKRGIKTQKEYAILTAEISKATFGITPSEYKKFKGLKRENLRDHMNDIERKTTPTFKFYTFIVEAQDIPQGH